MKSHLHKQVVNKCIVQNGENFEILNNPPIGEYFKSQIWFLNLYSGLKEEHDFDGDRYRIIVYLKDSGKQPDAHKFFCKNLKGGYDFLESGLAKQEDSVHLR